jgi:hypothetical protein
MGAASAVAPNRIVAHNWGTNLRTTPKRSTSDVRHSPSGSASGAGTTSVMLATAARSSERDTTVSMAAQISSRLTSLPPSVAASRTATAAASFPASLLTAG